MYNMSTDELLLVAKIFAYVIGNPSVTLTQLDKDAAKTLIKKVANERYDWSPKQKDEFMKLVDVMVK